MVRQIVIKKVDKPRNIDFEKDVQWLCDSFGFSTGRDSSNISMSILTGILKEISLQGSTSTESISKKLGLEVQRVNYHLRYLIDSGLLYRSKKRIFIREGSISLAIEEIRDDVNKIFDCMTKIGEDIDKKLGFEKRR